MCTEVCAHGSVQVEPWLAHAIRQQSRLVQTLPLCWANLLGTHNSAITLADGYGNLDEYFRGECSAPCKAPCAVFHGMQAFGLDASARQPAAAHLAGSVSNCLSQAPALSISMAPAYC